MLFCLDLSRRLKHTSKNMHWPHFFGPPGKLVLFTNRKSLTGFRLGPKSVTMNDSHLLNARYFALFHRILYT